MPMTDAGNWFEIVRAPPPGRPALFLDRDGVLIEEREYLADPAGVALLPGAAECMLAFRGRGFAIVVITNQSGIARGKFGWPEFFAVNARLASLLQANGAGWDMVLACPHHPTAGVGAYARDDSWRKPNSGMIDFAAAQLSIDVASSILVGDKEVDLKAGLAAGVGTLCHVLTGHGEAERPGILASGRPVLCLDNLGALPSTVANMHGRAATALGGT